MDNEGDFSITTLAYSRSRHESQRFQGREFCLDEPALQQLGQRAGEARSLPHHQRLERGRLSAAPVAADVALSKRRQRS